MKQMYYVATRALYVLVEASSEAEGRRLGTEALSELYRARLRREAPLDIRTVRPATPDEIEVIRAVRDCSSIAEG